jgi:cytochrome c
VTGNRNIQHARGACLLVALITLSACTGESGPVVATDNSAPSTAAAFIDQVILPAAEYLASAPYSQADLKQGERLAMQCRACHTLNEGGAVMLGPNLFGLFGRPAASMAGFDYSTEMRELSLTWTPAALDAWLANPARFLPGNRMAFAGISDEEDRNALIAYLLSVTT